MLKTHLTDLTATISSDALYGANSSVSGLDPFVIGPASTGSASGALSMTLYLTEAGTATPISLTDINQGQIGDCFLLSAMGEIARLKPSFISSNIIHQNANGTETVTLYNDASGMAPGYSSTSFRPISETVTNVFQSNGVNNGATQDVAGNQKEIWPQVIEKAAGLMGGGPGLSSIAAGGSPLIAMEELTGHAAQWADPSTLSYASLVNFVSNSDLMVFDTLQTGSEPGGLVNNHAYMFNGITGSGLNAMVHLANPWGVDQPSPIYVSQLSRGFSEVDIGHLS